MTKELDTKVINIERSAQLALKTLLIQVLNRYTLNPEEWTDWLEEETVVTTRIFGDWLNARDEKIAATLSQMLRDYIDTRIASDIVGHLKSAHETLIGRPVEVAILRTFTDIIMFVEKHCYAGREVKIKTTDSGWSLEAYTIHEKT